MRADLLPELVTERAALPELLKKLLQHAHDDGIYQLAKDRKGGNKDLEEAKRLSRCA
jgi:hypothetical protein